MTGTRFFIQLPILFKNKPLRGLMTNNHVLNEKKLNNGSEFTINMEILNEPVTIILNNTDFIYTSKFIDITFIQLSDDILRKINPLFLIPDNYDCNVDDEIYTAQYPGGKELYYGHGTIEKLNKMNYFHTVSTEHGSSGSPLIKMYNKDNKMELKVVGVHKASTGTDKYNDMNIATKFSIINYAICTLFNKKYIYDIEKARLPPKKLEDEEITELNNHGLEETTPPNIYICQNPSLSSILLLMRTNHSWYWTISESYPERYSVKILKNKYDWSLINPFMDISYSINEKIEHQFEVIIMWIKLSGLIYL